MESFWNLPNALRKPKMKIMDHNMSVEITKEVTAKLELDLTYLILSRLHILSNVYFIIIYI